MLHYLMRPSHVISLFIVIGICLPSGMVSAAPEGTLGMEWWPRNHLDKLGPAQNDNFGESVAIDGLWMVAGIRRDDGTFSDQGSAVFFQRVGHFWQRGTEVTGSGPTANDYFGADVAIDGSWAVIAAPGADHLGVQQAGAAFVFERVGSNWQLHSKLVDPNGAQSFMSYAERVAIDGDTIAIGYRNAPAGGTLRGRIDVIKLISDTWAYQESITPAGTADGDKIGEDVALQGDTLIFGAPKDTDAAAGGGAIFVYDRSGGSFSFTAKLLPQGSSNAGASLGSSVDIDGSRIVGGSPFSQEGGQGVTGAADVFFKPAAGAWMHEQHLADPTPLNGERFGNAVRISGDRILVGYRGVLEQVQFFELDTGTWVLADTVPAPNPGADDNFGFGIDLDGGRMVASTPLEDFGRGAAYLYEYGETTVSTITSVTPSPSQVGQTVTINFTVDSDSGTASGFANLESSIGFLCSLEDVINGSGSCTFTFFGAGDIELMLNYSFPNGGFAGSTSAPFMHTVTPLPTTTTITGNTPNPSIAGEPVTVSFNVAQNRGDDFPTGTVIISDGVDTCMASAPSGSCDISLTTPGTRMLVASYPGDSQYGASMSAPVSQDVMVGVDLAATKGQCFKNTGPGFMHDYEIEVRNNGSQTATGLLVEDTLPADVSFISSIPGSPVCEESGGTVSCNLPDLASGGITSVVISVQVDGAASGTLVNDVEVSAMGFEPTPGDNSDSLNTNVVPDLLVDRGFESCDGT